jgi:hypothetical protein
MAQFSGCGAAVIHLAAVSRIRMRPTCINRPALDPMSPAPQHSFTLSHHARERARERVGWAAATTERMLDRIFSNGIDASSPPSPVQRYLADKAAQHPGFTTKVFDEKVFVFRCTGSRSYKLITVYALPAGVRRANRRKNEGRLRCEPAAEPELGSGGTDVTRDGVVITRPARPGVAFFCRRRKYRGC